MKINCLTTFLDGTDRFEKGDTHSVSDDRAAYFISNGWASEVGAQPAVTPVVGDVNLDVQNASSGQGAVHG